VRIGTTTHRSAQEYLESVKAVPPSQCEGCSKSLIRIRLLAGLPAPPPELCGTPGNRPGPGFCSRSDRPGEGRGGPPQLDRPVATSSSEIASATPTGHVLRPRSVIALRMQLSSGDTQEGRGIGPFRERGHPRRIARAHSFHGRSRHTRIPPVCWSDASRPMRSGWPSRISSSGPGEMDSRTAARRDC
jgi:hypothetical protein